jgi:hypothetical protein
VSAAKQAEGSALNARAIQAANKNRRRFMCIVRVLRLRGLKEAAEYCNLLCNAWNAP